MTRTITVTACLAVPLLLSLATGCSKRRRSASNEISADQVVFASRPELAQTKLPPVEPPRGPTEPTSPDPIEGNFTVEQALGGLPGKAPPRARIHTDLGNLTCRFFADKAPRLVANFIGLARGNRPHWNVSKQAWVRRPFYDGLTFHRVIPNFMIQGGDPLGNGTGGPGYNVAYEAAAEIPFDRAGLLAPAKRGSQREFVSGSQFFVTDGPAPHLSGQFPVFGSCEPVAVVANIARVPQAGSQAGNRPLTAVRITGIEIWREDAPPAPPAPGKAPAKAPPTKIPAGGPAPTRPR